MVRLLLLLLGMLRTGRPARQQAAWYRAGDHYPPGPYPGNGPAGGQAAQTAPGQAVPFQFHSGQTVPVEAAGQTVPGGTAPLPPWQPAGSGRGAPAGPSGSGSPRPGRRIPRWVAWSAGAVVAGLIFRRAVASLVLTGLATALHLVGINAHLPQVKFAWPWQTITAGSTTDTSLGPWVLQKIEGISRPALGQANFDFLFTHKVSRNIGPWPCWYASTFNAVGHASATVDLNPGPAWWEPGRGHYRLQVLSAPAAGRPGHVTVTMVLPQPQLPQSVHDVTIDNLPSRPVASQHSWTYPGLGCGVVIKPQFPDSVLYAQAQRIAFYKSRHSPQITRALVGTAEGQAVQTIRDNFIQPTVNALGYTLDRLVIRWAAGP